MRFIRHGQWIHFNNMNIAGRLQLFTFTGDLTTRVDTGSAYLGQLFISLSILGCQQNLVQRYLSMKSEKEVKRLVYQLWYGYNR